MIRFDGRSGDTKSSRAFSSLLKTSEEAFIVEHQVCEVLGVVFRSTPARIELISQSKDFLGENLTKRVPVASS
jgi:hypothetical protein